MYNYDTGLFAQSESTKVDPTPDGDTVKEGFTVRNTPAISEIYDDLNILRHKGSIGLPDNVTIKVGDDNVWYAVDATETMRGIAKIATDEEVETGTSDNTIITPKKLNKVIEILDNNWKVEDTVVFSTSTTWTCPKNGLYIIQVGGAGGGGGGGTGFNNEIYDGKDGGRSSFGSYITADGGKGGFAKSVDNGTTSYFPTYFAGEGGEGGGYGASSNGSTGGDGDYNGWNGNNGIGGAGGGVYPLYNQCSQGGSYLTGLKGEDGTTSDNEYILTNYTAGSGGAGGALSSSSTYAYQTGAGGGGGGTSIGIYFLLKGSSYTITIGAGGTGGQAGDRYGATAGKGGNGGNGRILLARVKFDLDQE